MPYQIPGELYYTREHEWVRRLDDETASVGVTDYAFEGPTGIGSRAVLFIELPNVGTRVRVGEAIVTIESEKNVVVFPSPLSGEVIEVNRRLEEEPTLVGSDPYGDGWTIKLKMYDVKELDKLMNSGKYKSYLSETLNLRGFKC
ncbi:MAG: glycine cleavage system protein GcvH [Candidatus Bathyarchaeia archaeon]